MYIIGIVLFIVWLLVDFLIADGKQKKKILTEGGMEIKYKTLIDNILSMDSSARIFEVTGDSMRLGRSTIGGTGIFTLLQTFGSLSITFEHENMVFSKYKLDWRFNEHENQDIIFLKINQEINDYQDKLLIEKGLK